MIEYPIITEFRAWIESLSFDPNVMGGGVDLLPRQAVNALKGLPSNARDYAYPEGF